MTVHLVTPAKQIWHFYLVRNDGRKSSDEQAEITNWELIDYIALDESEKGKSITRFFVLRGILQEVGCQFNTIAVVQTDDPENETFSDGAMYDAMTRFRASKELD